MKMVRNKVIMTTEHFDFMNLSWFGFSCELTTEKMAKKSGPFTTPLSTPLQISQKDKKILPATMENKLPVWKYSWHQMYSTP